MIKALKKTKEYFLYILFFFLPSWMLIQNIALIIQVLLPPYFEKKNWTSIWKYSLLLFILFSYFNSLVNGVLVSELGSLLKLMPLIMVAVGFNTDKVKFVNALFFLFLGTIVVQVMALYGIINYTYFYEGKKYDLTNYSRLNSIMGIERPYLGYFSAVNVLLSYVFYKIKKKYVYIFSAVLAFGVIVFIAARLAMLLTLLFIIFILYKERIFTKYKIVFLVSSFLFLALFLFSDKKTSIQKRFSAIKNDSRTIIWSGYLNEIDKKGNYLFGNPNTKEVKENIFSYYKNYEGFKTNDRKAWFIKKNYNSHNQFLFEFTRGGVVGFILFCLPFFLIFKRNLKKKNGVNLMLLVSLIMFFFVENLLDRQIGIYLTAIIMYLTSKEEMHYFDFRKL
ncbi:O-antigen ligase family protein [Tenacibaculum xiamenense]|uniref:O-antigen ligase family protein n=1 Tax=Tenacibaculum xiamenense TaxID=1261553 RepID=UPI003894D8AB